MQERAVSGFFSRFGRRPTLVARAPGRVNLLGGHTDYNEGYVLPAAVDRAAWIAAAPREGAVVRVAALDLGEEVVFPLDPVPQREGNWADYVRGVAWALQQQGLEPVGLDAVLTSDVPVGAGLSSSAAVEVALGTAWRALSGLDLGRTALARVCQRAENDYVGVRCGIMDQMASVWGRENHTLLLDCRTLEVEPLLLPEGTVIVVADSGVRRELASSEYNRRRHECEEAVRILSRHLPGVRALRDVSREDFERLRDHLLERVRRRARHVVRANARVLLAAAALRQGDVGRVGWAMRRCHRSLRDDYEVSSPELDLLAQVAWSTSGCHGARLTGAGFGGCVVALAEEHAVPDLTRAWERAYQERFDGSPDVVVCRASGGAETMLLKID